LTKSWRKTQAPATAGATAYKPNTQRQRTAATKRRKLTFPESPRPQATVPPNSLGMREASKSRNPTKLRLFSRRMRPASDTFGIIKVMKIK
jgi:hypothetical protein